MIPVSNRILVVDDSATMRALVSKELSTRGYRVQTANDGAEAVERLCGESAAAAGPAGICDLVCLDIEMPRMDGYAALAAIRRRHPISKLPVIMVTSLDRGDEIVRALRTGANDYVTKPVDGDVLAARVETQLRVRLLSEAKDEFLRIASHDLKTPLAGVLGYADLLETMVIPGGGMSDRAGRIVAGIRDAGERMQKIIADFLEFQGARDGQMRLDLAVVDLNEVGRRAVEALAETARRKGIPLSFAPAPAPVLVRADAARLGQVADNFVGNAVKFSKAGEAIVARASAGADGGTFEVRDSGPGLSDDDLPKMFVKYARAANRPTGGEVSTGLGLAICREMIALHGGEVGVRNNPDRGATFWFRIPAEGPGSVGANPTGASPAGA